MVTTDNIEHLGSIHAGAIRPSKAIDGVAYDDTEGERQW